MENKSIHSRSEQFRDYLIGERIVWHNTPDIEGQYIVCKPPLEHYNIFYRGDIVIQSLPHFIWLVSVLHHLNNFNLDKLRELTKVMNETLVKRHDYNEQCIDNIADAVIHGERPKGRKRSIFFHPLSVLTPTEKMSISRREVKLHTDSIEEAIYNLHYDKKKVTQSDISRWLGCSRETVNRRITQELKDLVSELNLALKKKY